MIATEQPQSMIDNMDHGQLTDAPVQKLKRMLQESFSTFWLEQERLLDDFSAAFASSTRLTEVPSAMKNASHDVDEKSPKTPREAQHQRDRRSYFEQEEAISSKSARGAVLKKRADALAEDELDREWSDWPWYIWWMRLAEPERTGPLAFVVQSSRFESICLAVILTNAAFTVYTTNYAMKNLTTKETPVMSILELCFMSFYIVELILKMAVHRFYFFANHNYRWNIFDLFLVILAIFDFIILELLNLREFKSAFMRSLRLLKMSKIARMLRVLRFFDELRLMLNCVLNCFMSLFWAGLLLIFFNTLFSLIFVQGVTQLVIFEKGSLVEEEYDLTQYAFGSVQRGVLILLQITTGGVEWGPLYDVVAKSGPIYSVVFIFYIFFFFVAFINIVTSTFLEKTMQIAEPDLHEVMLTKRKHDLGIAKSMLDLMRTLDKDDSGRLTQGEFNELMENPQLLAFFEHHGLDIKDADLFFSILADAAGEDDVQVHHLVDGCLKMRGPASSLDVITMFHDMRINHESNKLFQRYVSTKIADLTRAYSHIAACLPELESVTEMRKRLAEQERLNAALIDSFQKREEARKAPITTQANLASSSSSFAQEQNLRNEPRALNLPDEADEWEVKAIKNKAINSQTAVYDAAGQGPSELDECIRLLTLQHKMLARREALMTENEAIMKDALMKENDRRDRILTLVKSQQRMLEEANKEKLALMDKFLMRAGETGASQQLEKLDIDQSELERSGATEASTQLNKSGIDQPDSEKKPAKRHDELSSAYAKQVRDQPQIYGKFGHGTHPSHSLPASNPSDTVSRLRPQTPAQTAFSLNGVLEYTPPERQVPAFNNRR